MSGTIILQNILRQLVICGCPLALIFIMSRFKCRRRTAWMVFAGILLVATAVNTAVLALVSMERMKQIYALVLLVPSLLFLLFSTKDKPSQLLFSFFTAINAVYFTSILSHFLVGGLINDNSTFIWLDAVIRALLFSLIIFLFVRYLRVPYQFLARHMKTRSWRVLSVIPMLFFGLVMFLGLYPHVRTDNLFSVVFLYIILCFVYFIIYEVFQNTYDLIQQQQDNDILKTQVRALYNQVDMLRRTEEQIRLYRHDMRHYTENIAALLRGGDVEAAIRFVDQFHDKFKEPSGPRYGKNPTISAILSSYLERAQDIGARISFKGDLAEKLPCDEIALATVFANAIENACHALEKLPEGDGRRLEIVCVNGPQLVIEIANAFDGQVEFDENHYPITHENSHGLGTKSILAFAKDNNAFLDYKVDKSMFRLRILINKPD